MLKKILRVKKKLQKQTERNNEQSHYTKGKIFKISKLMLIYLHENLVLSFRITSLSK